MTDPYETRRPIEYWTAMQEAALDAQGLDWVWYVDRVMEIGIAEMEDEA